jgi:hypothetical protein
MRRLIAFLTRARPASGHYEEMHSIISEIVLAKLEASRIERTRERVTDLWL